MSYNTLQLNSTTLWQRDKVKQLCFDVTSCVAESSTSGAALRYMLPAEGKRPAVPSP
jgi:hypothetical protein